MDAMLERNDIESFANPRLCHLHSLLLTLGNNLPVFFIRDTIKFPDVIHSLKPDPVTNVQDPNRFFDLFSLIPESTHMLSWLYSDLGIPASYRYVPGYDLVQWFDVLYEFLS